MQFRLFWMDFLELKLFGFGFFNVRTKSFNSNLLSFYFYYDEIIIDLFYKRICGAI
jgi:hypothetical protein